MIFTLLHGILKTKGKNPNPNNRQTKQKNSEHENRKGYQREGG